MEWAGDAQGNETGRDAQKNKMGQGSSIAMKWAKEAQSSMSTKPNDSTRLLEFSRRKAYNSPKRGPASISQIITWQEQRGGMVGLSIDLQRG